MTISNLQMEKPRHREISEIISEVVELGVAPASSTEPSRLCCLQFRKWSVYF